MGFTLYALFKASVLLLNSLVIINARLLKQGSLMLSTHFIVSLVGWTPPAPDAPQTPKYIAMEFRIQESFAGIA